MRLSHIAVKCLSIESELPYVGRLEFLGLQLKCDEALKTAMVEHEGYGEVLIADLHRVLRTNKTKVTSQLS